MEPKDENDTFMINFNFFFFFALGMVVGCFQVPWTMRSIKKNGPSFSASLVIFFGILFSSLFDFILFEAENRGLRAQFGELIFTVGIFLIGYEKFLYELEKPNSKTYEKMKDLEEGQGLQNQLEMTERELTSPKIHSRRGDETIDL